MRERLASLSRSLGAVSGPGGKISVARLIATGMIWRRRGGPLPAARALPMAELGGEPLWIRPGTTDLSNAVAYYSLRLYLPPPEVRGGPLRTICELGTNMGAALTGLGFAYPEARICGVEPDEANFAIAERNVARFGERVQVRRAAVWDRSGSVRVDRETGRGEHGISVDEVPERESVGETVEARTLDDILDWFAGEAPIDYMHVSMEGSEERIFAAGGRWPERVRSLRVEAHPYLDYEASRCVEQLTALGYRAWAAPEMPGKWVYAVRGTEPAASARQISR